MFDWIGDGIGELIDNEIGEFVDDEIGELVDDIVWAFVDNDTCTSSDVGILELAEVVW